LIAFSLPVQPCRVVSGPICLVGEVLSQTCLDKKRTGLLMARQPPNRRAHEQLETNQGADGISRQAKNQRLTRSAKKDRLARLHFNFVKMCLHTKLLQYAGYEIELARRYASGEYEKIRLETFLYSGSK